MFAKLYSRITESSLMEQPIEVRYTFIMLLAIADPTGRVVGTDVAIARRLNIPLLTFVNSVKILEEPDPDSNSKEEEGRRVIASDGERGYQLVNYEKYRNLKNEDEKRQYMREYMRNRRQSPAAVKLCKPLLNVLTNVTQAEAEADLEPERQKSAVAPAVVPSKPKETDEEWLSSLSADPTYHGINVQIQFGKMRNWCEQHGKAPSRRRFINWLNRIEKPMQGQEAGPYGHLKILG